MAYLEAPPTAFEPVHSMRPGVEAATIIVATTEELTSGREASPEELAREIEKRAEGASLEAQAPIQQYIVGLLVLTRYGASVAVLPQGVGGLYNGGIKIAASTVRPDEAALGMTTVIARMKETGEHEGYHARHRHETPIVVSPEATQQNIVVTIGNERFRDQAEIVEALTVVDTGDRFVSIEYHARMEKLLRAVSTSDVTLDDVRKAVNVDHDLTDTDNTPRAPATDAAEVGVG